MPLIDQVQQDMVAAMKSKDEARLSAIRMIKAALMKAKVDSPKPLDEAAEMQILKQLVKQRVDAAEAFRNAGRAEQAAKEEAERALIESHKGFHHDDVHFDLGNLDVDAALIVAGRGGVIRLEDEVEIRRLLPSIAIRRLEGAGHQMQIEDTEGFLAIVEELLAMPHARQVNVSTSR